MVITPPAGVELAGYGFGPSAGMLEDLTAQALAAGAEPLFRQTAVRMLEALF